MVLIHNLNNLNSVNGNSTVNASKEKEANQQSLRLKYYDLIQYGNQHPQTVHQNLEQLRKKILLDGIPDDTEAEIEERKKGVNKCSLRGLIWKILLGIKEVNAENYIELVKKGASKMYQKIRKDIGRTFMKDSQFSQIVSQDQLSRCLNAFAHDCPELGYVQGMNVICGAFLYVLPEIDAYYCFSTFATQCCHLYLDAKITGVHTATNLLDLILEFVDPELYDHLKTRNYHPYLFTQPILSLGTSTPPLDQVLQLWDFYFAFGVHLNVICTISQLLLMRDVLLHHPSPCSLLRTFPEIDAKTILNISIHIIRQLPDYLYDLLVVHPVEQIDLSNLNNVSNFLGSNTL